MFDLQRVFMCAPKAIPYPESLTFQSCGTNPCSGCSHPPCDSCMNLGDEHVPRCKWIRFSSDETPQGADGAWALSELDFMYKDKLSWGSKRQQGWKALALIPPSRGVNCMCGNIRNCAASRDDRLVEGSAKLNQRVFIDSDGTNEGPERFQITGCTA